MGWSAPIQRRGADEGDRVMCRACESEVEPTRHTDGTSVCVECGVVVQWEPVPSETDNEWLRSWTVEAEV